MKKTKIFLIFALIIFQLQIFSFSYFEGVIWPNSEFLEVSAPLSETTPSPILTLESESAILMEQTTGKILFEKNPHEKLRPASVTKIMSILLIMEALDSGKITLETQIPCSEHASSMGGSQIWLDQTETLSVDEMLKAICVVSANDCTVAMAEYLYGSEELFVQKMNSKAKELGMNDTNFKNCHGIDEDEHFTSSYDIALMSKELMQHHPNIKNYTTIWNDSLRNGNSSLVNTNKLIRNYAGITGLKTGSTSLALYNLSATATRDNLSLIAVILRAPTPKIRFSEAKLLLDFGFNNYKVEQLATKNDIFQNAFVNKGIQNNVNLIFENSAFVIKEKQDSNEIYQELNINENLEAPIEKNSILGTINYYSNNELIASVNLLAETDIKKKTFFNEFQHIISNYINIFRYS